MRKTINCKILTRTMSTKLDMCLIGCSKIRNLNIKISTVRRSSRQNRWCVCAGVITLGVRTFGETGDNLTVLSFLLHI